MNKCPNDIMLKLNEKFANNFKSWSSLKDNRLNKTFIYLRCIAAIGEILDSRKNSKHQTICCSIYDEIFSDGVSAIYLASNAMDKPANIVLRRILELGVASVYLWDMPHVAYSWKDYDHDLRFSEMLTHVNSKGYLAFVSNENSISIESDIFPVSKTQKIYGNLSNIVHGKITTFESLLTDRFTFVENEWNVFADLMAEVLEILIRGYLIRYTISEYLFEKVPQARKEFS